METQANPPDLTLLLPRSTYQHLMQMLRSALPSPGGETPSSLAHRDNAAIAEVAAMLPGNADEAALAAQCVLARAYAAESFRLAEAHPNDPSLAAKCHDRGGRMLREARATRTLLLRLQAERHKREANADATDQAAWTEHCAIGLMAQAVSDAPAHGESPPSPTPEPALDQPPSDLATEAEQYAIIYPRRAALIRSLGRLPDNPDFGPPAPELVHAIVTGTSPAMRALDMQNAG